MQEPKPDGDSQLTEQVNQVLNTSVGNSLLFKQQYPDNMRLHCVQVSSA